MEHLPIELWYQIGRLAPTLLQVSKSIVAYEREMLARRIKLATVECARNPIALLYRIIGENDVGMWRYYWPFWTSNNSYKKKLSSIAIAASHHCNYNALSAIWSTWLDTQPVHVDVASLHKYEGPWEHDPLLFDPLFFFGAAVVMAHLLVVNQNEQSNQRCELIITKIDDKYLLIYAIMFAIFYDRIEYGYQLYLNYRNSRRIDHRYILAALYAVAPSELVLLWREEIAAINTGLVDKSLLLAKCWRGDMLSQVECISARGLADDVFRPEFLINPAMPPIMIERWPFKYSAERDRLILSSLSKIQRLVIEMRKENNPFSYQYYERKFREHGMHL